MNRSLFALIILIFSSFFPFPAESQNPFISKAPEQEAYQDRKAAPRYPFLDKISEWQHGLNEKMALLIRKAKESGSLQPLLTLIGLAFAYGLLHAAGPGHGKAVAASYLLSHKSKPSRGILLGNMAAFFHGMSGVLLVLIVHAVLMKGVTGSLEHVTQTTQLFSYALIAVLGAFLLAKNILLLWHKTNNDGETYHSGFFHAKKGG